MEKSSRPRKSVEPMGALDRTRSRGEGEPAMPGLTLRQVEVIRAVMMTGSITGAAEYLNVSGPGISRLVKHAEETLRVRLFERKGGVFLPAPEARAVFDQINEVYGKIEGLDTAIANLSSGESGALAFASVPSVAQFIVARACVAIRKRFPDLYIDLNVLKIEEAVDYLLLERGELVAMSYAFAHPSLEFDELGTGELVAVVPDGHALAAHSRVSVRDLVRQPLIGVSPDDPYGAIIAGPFRAARVDYRLSIRARFAQTVVSLVRHGLGVAVIDEFSVAGVYMPGLTRIPLEETEELRAAVKHRPWDAAARPRLT
jgi:DNA-binding transcriptional LysR family regulator